MTRLLLALVYPAILVARLFNALFGRDPLRLSRPEGATYWIARTTAPDDRAYFLEDSPAEGRGHGGAAGFVETLLIALARAYAPPRQASAEKFSAAADREQGIPDEMYTLW